MVHYQSQCA
jgi:hypothetical protein